MGRAVNLRESTAQPPSATDGAHRQLDLDAVRDAEGAIYAVARRTPLVPLDALDVANGQRSAHPEVFLKLETLQPIGSFKIRGGVALAARQMGVPCSVLVIETAPQTKLEAIERLGARIVKASYDECWRTLEQHDADRLPGTFVHPFDDDHFIAGNGTIGLEILDDLVDVDAVVVSVGGGGLLAGVATAVRALKPDTRIYAAEPETAAPLARSLERGRASYFEEWQPSFVDGCGGKSVIPTMWPLLRDLVDGSVVVSLGEIKEAMKLVARRAHVVAEGAGACAAAAAISGRAGAGKIAAVISGGNIDLATFAKLVQ
jgi:threonine dehydratase